MNRTHRAFRAELFAGVFASLLLLTSAATPAADAPPVSKDGLTLQKQTKQRLVYVKPGATLAQYKRVHIIECYVEFAKDWQRDYNRNTTSLDRKVSDADVQRMKTRLSDAFKKVFTDELQNKGGYQVVDVAAPDVLVLRPAIINVQVTAPDVQSAGISRTIIQSAGQATLYLELWDSSTNTILARVVDAQADQNSYAQRGNAVTNTAAAETVLRRWAHELRQKLDTANGKNT
ncbi:MAG TPA: DUF3313 family protein [Steroidobacteraceae bacterium]|nr:DUF3313 family protein [Steroidobacteraceae bacterium]